LHRWLEGTGQQPSFRPVSPFAYYLSRLCEEFPGTLPSEMLAEIDRLPVGLLEEIIESRAYARAHAANAANVPDWHKSPIRTRAMHIEHALAEEDIG